MAFDWYEYIKLSEEFVEEDSPSEAKLRSAVSRAYYGAFIKCKIKSQINSNIDIHKKVIEYFKRGNSKEQFIGNALSKLRSKRNNADYDGHENFLKREVESSIKSAIEIINLLPKLDEED